MFIFRDQRNFNGVRHEIVMAPTAGLTVKGHGSGRTLQGPSAAMTFYRQALSIDAHALGPAWPCASRLILGALDGGVDEGARGQQALALRRTQVTPRLGRHEAVK